MPRTGKQAIPLGKRTELLESTHWARDFKRDQLDRLARHMEVHRYPLGATLFLEGDRDTKMGIIVEGRIAIEKSARSEETTSLAQLGPGKSFGEMALIDGEPRSASARAAEDVLMLILTPEGFDALCEETPTLAIRLLLRISKMMSQRLRMTSSRLADFLDPEDS